MRYLALGTVLLAGVTLSACSTAPVNFDGNSFVAEDRHRSVIPKPAANACPIRVRSISDARSQKASLGWVAGRPLKVENFPAMAHEGIVHGLAQSGAFRIIDDSEAIEPAVTMDGEVLKAYMKSMSTSMIANIAMRIRFTRSDGQQETVMIRGHDTSVNWASGDGEVKESLSLALIDVAKQAQRVLTKQCEQLSVKVTPEKTSVR